MAGLERCRIAVVGLGNIGRILVERLCAAGVPAASLMICDADRAREDALASRFGVRPVELEAAAESADLVLLAVPPKATLDLVKRLAGHLHSGQLVISFAAAIPLSSLEALIPPEVAVVRVMPSAPSLVGAGMNPVCYGRGVGEAEKALVRQLLSALGESIEVQDAQMNWCVGLSGAAMRSLLPALEGMMRAGVEAGLPPEQARYVAAQVMRGTAELALQSDLAIEDLKALTPMETLDEALLAEMLLQAARGARQRTEEAERKLMGRGGES